MPNNKTPKLTDLQIYVTKQKGTEPPFNNEYWDNKKAGIYVDIISGEALFASYDKFDSGSGWPSFTKPIAENALSEKSDYSHGMSRTEIVSKSSDAHLGHVFADGPIEDGGMRYCINSASLRFIAKEDLTEQGYGKYLALFDSEEKMETAILAGGCFWGMEELFRKQAGVIETIVGYTGGQSKKPKYELVSSGKSGHAEALKIKFDANKISYTEILKFFFRIHDSTSLNRQGNDIGSQYRSAIFYKNNGQKIAAKQLIEKINAAEILPGRIVTEIKEAGEFFPAEEYHQNYLQKTPHGYTCHFPREEWKFDF